jgi:hypothetical protein
VTWRVFATATSDADFVALDEAERAALAEDLFALAPGTRDPTFGLAGRV